MELPTPFVQNMPPYAWNSGGRRHSPWKQNFWHQLTAEEELMLLRVFLVYSYILNTVQHREFSSLGKSDLLYSRDKEKSASINFIWTSLE